MVGRGGRSRACFVCRQRRLKCDETKPLCLRCRNDALACTGYPSNLTFINTGPRTESRATGRTAMLPRPQPDLTVLNDDVFRAYLKQELRDGTTLIDNRWPGFSALDQPEGLSRRCITSFAAALFGRRNGSERGRKQGVRLYIQSLEELNERLFQPEISSAGQIALSINILAVCECLAATSVSGWIQHMVGLAAYYRLCPFEMFRDPHVLRQFEGSRFSMITAAIAARRPAPLMSEDWTVLPWSFGQSTKSQRQYLLDHAAQLPNLYLDYAAYLEATDDVAKSARSLTLETSLNGFLHTLRNWELHWNSTENQLVEETSTWARELRDHGFIKIGFIEAEGSTTTYLLYKTIAIFLFELWKTFRKAQAAASSMTPNDSSANHQQLNTSQASPHESNDNQPEDKAPTNASISNQSRQAALDICRTLPFFQTPSGGWIYAIQLTTTMRMALVVLRQDEGSPQAAWLQDLIRQLSESRQGWGIGRYLMDGHGYY